MIMQYTIIHHRNWIVNCKVAIWRFFLFFYTDIQVLAEYGEKIRRRVALEHAAPLTFSD